MGSRNHESSRRRRCRPSRAASGCLQDCCSKKDASVPQLPEPLDRLISELSRLPGIGPKTAQRLAFHLLRADRQRAESLALAIADVKARIGYCERCYNIAEGSLCTICASSRRDASVICVVESSLDVLPIERTAEFDGL